MSGRWRAVVSLDWRPSFLNQIYIAGAILLAPLALAYADETEAIEFNESFLRSSVDVSQFSSGNPVAPGIHRIDLYLNDQWKGRQDVNFSLASPQSSIAQPCYDLKLLSLFDIALDKLDKAVLSRLQQGEQCIALGELVPGVEGNFDSGGQRLDVRAPQSLLQHEARGYVSPELWDNGITAATLQYDYNAYRSDHSDSSSQTTQFLGLRGGLNWDVWRLRYRASANWNDDEGFRYQSNETYLERPLVGWRSRMVLGQSTTDGQVFDSIGFIGAQISSDDRMYSDSQRGFAPVVRGIANTNALVRVSQRGSQIYETTVPPGPFVIDDLYPTGSGGDLLVTVTEADGTERSFTVTYASIAELLRPGVTHYSLMAGKYRNNSVSEEPAIAVGTLRHGFTNLLTGYTGVIGADGYAAASGGLAFNTDFGALSADITQAQTQFDNRPNEQGQSVRLTYAKILPVVDTNITLASYRYSSSGYYNVDDAMLLRDRDSNDSGFADYNSWKRRNRLQINASQSLPEGFGTVALNANVQDYWDHDQTDREYQLSYNNHYNKLNYGVNFARTRNLATGNWDNKAMLTLSIPLGSSSRAPNLTSSYTQQKDRQGLQNSLSGSLGEDRQYNYSAFTNYDYDKNGSNSVSGGVNGSWAAPYAFVGGSVSAGQGYQQYGANMSGGLVAYSGGVVFTPMLGETSAIVEAENAKGARITNYSGLRLDNSGKAVVPYLSPYRQNTVELDPKGLSRDVELKYTSQKIAPTAGAVGLLRYETESGYSILVTTRDVAGNPLPFGANVSDEQQRSVGYIGQVGEGLLRVNNPKGQLEVKWGEGAGESCRFNYQLPAVSPGDESDYRRLEVICQ
ncbi:fimbria/pilus outer membrane usher protein [Serratia fonticola]|uniref:fimbria/pilus outer membrane usher protein n=1 Tax=Serratia fonticola TaxID=47917 RepID=UPI0024DE3FCB|nr:fimbria/pilus outer membrane usher protein [Serratia fonticola]MDK2378199.1 fimbria/pilus outer membrane usher protein [Serratia fonticola]